MADIVLSWNIVTSYIILVISRQTEYKTKWMRDLVSNQKIRSAQLPKLLTLHAAFLAPKFSTNT